MKGVFIGYCTSAKAYRIYLPDTEKVLVSRDVRFMESETWKWPKIQKASSSVISLQKRGDISAGNSENNTSSGNTSPRNSGNGESNGSSSAKGGSDRNSLVRQFE